MPYIFFVHTLNYRFNLVTCSTCILDFWYLITEQFKLNFDMYFRCPYIFCHWGYFLMHKTRNTLRIFHDKIDIYQTSTYANPLLLLLSYSSLALLYFLSYFWCFCLLEIPCPCHCIIRILLTDPQYGKSTIPLLLLYCMIQTNTLTMGSYTCNGNNSFTKNANIFWVVAYFVRWVNFIMPWVLFGTFQIKSSSVKCKRMEHLAYVGISFWWSIFMFIEIGTCYYKKYVSFFGHDIVSNVYLWPLVYALYKTSKGPFQQLAAVSAAAVQPSNSVAYAASNQQLTPQQTASSSSSLKSSLNAQQTCQKFLRLTHIYNIHAFGLNFINNNGQSFKSSANYLWPEVLVPLLCACRSTLHVST